VTRRPFILYTQLLLLNTNARVFARLPDDVDAEDNIIFYLLEGEGYRPGYPDAPDADQHLVLGTVEARGDCKLGGIAISFA